MSFNLDSLFIEWRRIVPTGVPNPKNAYHLTLLKEICLSKGISTEVVDSVMLVLEAEEKPLDDKVKFIPCNENRLIYSYTRTNKNAARKEKLNK